MDADLKRAKANERLRKGSSWLRRGVSCVFFGGQGIKKRDENVGKRKKRVVRFGAASSRLFCKAILRALRREMSEFDGQLRWNLRGSCFVGGERRRTRPGLLNERLDETPVGWEKSFFFFSLKMPEQGPTASDCFGPDGLRETLKEIGVVRREEGGTGTSVLKA